MAAEELTTALDFTESRPARRRVSRLSAEMMKEIFNSDTDCSDNDPDFNIDEKRSKSRHSLPFHLSTSKGSLHTSEDIDEPDECLPQMKVAKRRKKRGLSKETKQPKTPKHTKTKQPKTPKHTKRSPPVARPLKQAEKHSPVLPSAPNVPEARARRGLRCNPKPISVWAAPSNVPSLTPPMASSQSGYTEWNEDTDIVEPVRAPGEESYYCCVEGCVSGGTSDKEGLWLFAMPKKEQLMSVWDERLPIDYERNLPLSPRVCYRHFHKTDFVRRQQRLVGLKQDALPIKTERPGPPVFKEESLP